MKKYTEPQLEISVFSAEDVLNTSAVETPVLNNNGEYVYQSTGTTTYGTFWE